MSAEVISAERRWKESHNPLYEFMFSSYHPDIEIFSSVSGTWSQARKLPPTSLETDNPDTRSTESLGIPIV